MGRIAASLAPPHRREPGSSPRRPPINESQDPDTRAAAVGVARAPASPCPRSPAPTTAARRLPRPAAPARSTLPSCSSRPARCTSAAACRSAAPLPDAANQTVVLQTRDASGLWQSVATTSGDAHGNFSASWHPLLSGEYDLRAAISGAQASDSATASVVAPGARLQARARELVRPGLLREADGLRQEAEPGDHRRRQPPPALRHADRGRLQGQVGGGHA